VETYYVLEANEIVIRRKSKIEKEIPDLTNKMRKAGVPWLTPGPPREDRRNES
jgi:hypothetical protein